jgi:HEAT repeat protein
MSHIFISYYQGDADFAAVLSIHLEKAGFDTWMDKNRLRPGQDWSVEIDEAITNSHALIVIMSPEAKASEYVTYEWSFALGAGVQVIPVLYKETTLHPRLARIQYLKFTDTTVRPWDVLIETVKEAAESSDLYAVKVPRNAPPHIKSAILALDSANEADRSGAISILAQTEHPAAKAALSASLRHPLISVRWAAALNIDEDERAIPILVEAFLNADDDDEYSDPEYKSYSEHLKEFGSAGMDALLELLISSDERYSAAADALGDYREGEPVSQLLQLLSEPDVKRRVRAAHALQYFPSERVEAELLNCMNDPNDEVRAEVVSSLKELSKEKSTEIYEALLAAIQDSSEHVRRKAASGLDAGTPEHIKETLLELMRSKTPYIALAAHRAALHMGEKTPGTFEHKMVELGFIKSYDHNAPPSAGAILISMHALYGMDDTYYVLAEHQKESIKLHRIEEDHTRVFMSADDSPIRHGLELYYVTDLSIDIPST